MNAYPVICRFKFRLSLHKLLENHMFTAQYIMKPIEARKITRQTLKTELERISNEKKLENIEIRYLMTFN